MVGPYGRTIIMLGGPTTVGPYGRTIIMLGGPTAVGPYVCRGKIPPPKSHGDASFASPGLVHIVMPSPR